MTLSKDIHVSVSPHDRGRISTRRIMLDVLIALIPACAAGVYAFGWYSLAVILVTVASCVLTELVYQKIMHKQVTVGDLSAAVTGVILALNMPPEIPIWIPAIGGVFAILVVKQLFGGLGQNFMNPALAARCFLLLCFAAAMTDFPETVHTLFAFGDGVTTATPLAALRAGQVMDWKSVMLDMHSGCIGEAWTPAILLGALYLLVRRVIDIRIPGIYIVSTMAFIALIAVIQGQAEILSFNYMVAQLCGGGLLIGAFFMANDYVTCPATPLGQVLYALLLGLLTALFRMIGSAGEGVSYAIIIGNCVSPLIERITMPKPFGKGGRKTA